MARACSSPVLLQVGTFLTVHLYAHGGFVQQGRDLRIAEGLLFHNVAPVTGGIADGQKDRFVLRFSFQEDFRGPWVPIHGVPGVL